jgi:two-component system alkaline phosphatase synthesis response regulator PhoP
MTNTTRIGTAALLEPVRDTNVSTSPMSSRRQILTVEDDAAIRRGIVDALEFAGYEVLQAGEGETGMKMAVQRSYDLLLLDLVLPGHSGLDILRAVRATRPTQPVIILSAKGQEADRVAGLRDGADDYVVKPFSVKELLARVEAVLRRSPERPTDLQQVDVECGTIDFSRREIRYDEGSRVELSEKETELLRYLVTNAGRAIARDEILSNVWRISPKGITTRTIDMHVARLREKLRDDSAEPRVLLTVRGKGYMFALTDKEST